MLLTAIYIGGVFASLKLKKGFLWAITWPIELGASLAQWTISNAVDFDG